MSQINKIDSDALLDDFKSEAKSHIEKIESAFLDAGVFESDPALIDDVFRAAHSLKGTAGFFSLNKIVAVAHELENVFSKIKNGRLKPDDDIADVVLKSVDYLKDLADNLHDQDAVDPNGVDGVIELLKLYSDTPKRHHTEEEDAEEIAMPFDLSAPATESALKSAVKRGHMVYYLSVTFDERLGRYYIQPSGLTDDILSIGVILEAAVNGAAIDAATPSEFAAKITEKLSKHSASLELLVTSVLEPELFLIAVEIDRRFLRLIPMNKTSPEFPAELPGEVSGEESGPQSQSNQIHDTHGTYPQSAESRTAGRGAAGLSNTQSSQGSKPDFSIRLDVSAVNGLMDLANEMILTRNQLLSAMSAHRKSIAGITPVLHDVSRLTSEIQDKVMRTRMQPVSVVFGKFPRIIRDTARSLHKDIQIKISGSGVALDKYLLDALSDPITQIVKNSADHGIEDAVRRAELGKPQKGTITLGAFMRDGAAVIEVTDDGAGIDTETLKRKCAERGILTEERLAAMTRSDLFNLIFEPGLSTAKQVTNFSGRGVGMDIVKTNIEKLGGSVEVESEPDNGTVIRLIMPLTLSLVRALIVTVNSVHYAVPETNLERIVRVSENSPSKRLERINNSPVLNLDGWVMPAVTVEELDARYKGEEPPPAEEILERRRKAALGGAVVTKCLVMKARDRHFALLIDDALETEETLIKPLPIYLRSCLCYSGVTVLGSGKAIMILDAEGIMRFAGIDGVEKKQDAEAQSAADENARQAIIFKCSGAEYFALDADRIARIERIDPRHIQDVGGGQFVNVAGKSVRIIRPEDYAPVQKRGYDKDKLYLLTLKTDAPGEPDLPGENGEAAADCGTDGAKIPPLGVLAGRVIDKVEESFALEGGIADSAHVLGTGVYNEKIIIFLNSEEMIRTVRAERRCG